MWRSSSSSSLYICRFTCGNTRDNNRKGFVWLQLVLLSGRTEGGPEVDPEEVADLGRDPRKVDRVNAGGVVLGGEGPVRGHLLDGRVHVVASPFECVHLQYPDDMDGEGRGRRI